MVEGIEEDELTRSMDRLAGGSFEERCCVIDLSVLIRSGFIIILVRLVLQQRSITFFRAKRDLISSLLHGICKRSARAVTRGRRQEKRNDRQRTYEGNYEGSHLSTDTDQETGIRRLLQREDVRGETYTSLFDVEH